MGGAGPARKRIVGSEIRQRATQKNASRVGPRKADYSLVGFEKFCRGLKVENGEPLVLEPFQKRSLRDHFDGVTEVVVILPKKNGKSTVFAALALYHLQHWPGADVVIAASSRDQARILFNQAAGMVDRSNLSEYEVKGRHGGTYSHIRHRGSNASIRVLAADAKTADGVLPTLALVDELHRHPSGELYGVFRDGLDARNGRMITMSTAGASEDSALGLLRAKAQKLPNYRRRGTYCHAKSPDGSFVLHEWSLKPDDDPEDLKKVKKANPLSTQTIEKLKRRKGSPSMTPGRWLRFGCGIWTEGEDPWLEPGQWDRLKVDIGGVQQGEVVWVSVNVGLNPAIVLAAQRDKGGVAVKAEIFEGAKPLEVVETKLQELAEAYQVEEITYDRAGFQRSAELLEEQGLPMLELPHSTERMSIVTVTLERLIQGRKLRHDGDERLRAHVLAGAIKDSERGKRLINGQRTRALIAMAVACHQATQIEHDQDPLVVFA